MKDRWVYSALVSIALLAAWLGVAVFVAAVLAPAAFAVLPTRALAGALVARALPILFISGIVTGSLVVALSAGRSRLASLGGLLLLSGNAAASMVEQRLHAMLVAMGAPIDAIAGTDPRRIAFGRLHGLSVLVLGVGVVGASIALVVLMRRIRALQPTVTLSEHSDALSVRRASPHS